MREQVDVLVVGAGPAGTATAIAARDRGLSVLVIDKARFPRDKTCGDGLTAAALRLLERLGLAVSSLPSYAVVTETVLLSPSGRRVTLPLPDHGHYAGIVPRTDLDAALVRVARARGADVREGAAVGSVTPGRDAVDVTVGTASVRAQFLVAADGHYSTVRRLLEPGAPADLGSWHAFRQYFCGVDDPRLWVLFEDELLPGYAWVFPLPDGHANVGFGVPRRPGVDGRTLKTHWRELLDRDRLRDVLGPGARPAAAHRAWPIPTRFEAARLVHGRVLYVGDAAAVVDPMTGEGIAQALETGIAAAEAVAGGGDGTAVGLRYRRAVERTLGADLRIAQLLSRVLASRRGARAALRAVDLSGWTRRNFAPWMYEDYPRAALFTPRRWRRGMLAGKGAFASMFVQ
jgi:geranylgeranyl reductase family protein